MHHLESELDSIAQSIYCSKKCHGCPYLRRIRKMQGAARTVMDYGRRTKNTTLQSFNDMRDKRTPAEREVRAGKINRRVRKDDIQCSLEIGLQESPGANGDSGCCGGTS